MRQLGRPTWVPLFSQALITIDPEGGQPVKRDLHLAPSGPPDFYRISSELFPKFFRPCEGHQTCQAPNLNLMKDEPTVRQWLAATFEVTWRTALWKIKTSPGVHC